MTAEGGPVRARLPGRRLVETRRVAHHTPFGERRFFVSIGYDPASPAEPREVFLDGGFRSGAELEALLKDAAIALSLLLQHGVAPASIVDALAAGGGRSAIAGMAAELGAPPFEVTPVRRTNP